MKIFIAPARRMHQDEDFILPPTVPVHLLSAQLLAGYCRNLSYEELKKLLACNDQIAKLNYERYRDMQFSKNLSPAIFAYDGIQYQYMAPQVFEMEYFDYIQKNLRIISGLYGVLKPFDGVVCYRLDMCSKVKLPLFKNLYEFWDDAIYRELTKDNEVLVNLASAEYAKCVTKYLKPTDRMVTCIFAEQVGDKLVEKGVYVKMARGEMVRFLAEKNADSPEVMKKFDRLDYRFCKERSDDNKYVFIRSKGGKTGGI